MAFNLTRFRRTGLDTPAAAPSGAASSEQSFLRLEDLVDQPIELTLSDFGALELAPSPSLPQHAVH